MTETTQIGTFFKKGSSLQNYLAYPKFLLTMDLNDSAKLIYIILLDRVRIACRRDNCTNTDGHVYIIYEIEELSARSGKSLSTVKNALRDLEMSGLIYRDAQIVGQPRRIYVKRIEESPKQKNRLPTEPISCPPTEPTSCLPAEPISCPPRSQYSTPHGANILPPYGANISPLYYNKYKNNIYKTNIRKNYTYTEGESL